MPNTRQILIVNDDPELRDALSEQLSLYEEFKAFVDGRKGVQAAKAGQIDLVIMDVGLPDIDGHEAVRILRKNGFKAPIIMLTGHDTDSDTILIVSRTASMINSHGRQLLMAIRCSFIGILARQTPIDDLVLRLVVGLGVERELVKPLGVAQEDI
jgi:CheY-like chemotaxis protein